MEIQKVDIEDVVNRLRGTLIVCHKYMAQYKWWNTMCKNDISMSNQNLQRVILANRGAALDLSVAQRDNISVDNHATI